MRRRLSKFRHVMKMGENEMSERSEMFDALDRFDKALADLMNAHRRQAFRVVYETSRGEKPQRPANLSPDYPYEIAPVKTDADYDVWAIMTVEKVIPITPEMRALWEEYRVLNDDYLYHAERFQGRLWTMFVKMMERGE